ncbi:MAG: glycosyltransferase family 2 protein [Bacteroidia bacterium]
MPKLSIITVTYQAEAVLPLTLRSVASQTWRDWEHILVDGASTDNTPRLIQAYAEQVPNVRWISEPDKGIYDAMNKGLDMAQGEFVVFLNAGDIFWRPTTLEELFTQAPPEADLLYGDHYYINLQGERVLRRRHRPYPRGGLQLKHLHTGMVVCHQAIFVRRTLAPAYNSRFHFAGDLDWLIRILQKPCQTYDTQKVLVGYLVEGGSDRYILQHIWVRTGILRRYFGIGAVLKSYWAMLANLWHGGYPAVE